MKEIWKDVVGYEGLYQVSNWGRVRRPKSKILLSSKPSSKREYCQVSLYKNKKYKAAYTHRLVAEAFMGKIEKGKCVNHKNLNKTDNRLENLEIVSYGENTSHYYREKRGVMGFSIERGRFRVRIKAGGLLVNIGCYNSAHEAQCFFRSAYLSWYGKELKLLPIED